VLCTFLRVDDEPDPGTPQAYRDNRARDAAAVVAAIEDAGGTAIAVEADLPDPATPAVLFDTAEERLGPVDILVNNATGWLADTFAPVQSDRLGRTLQPVTATTWTQQFSVDAMGAALMIGEFARRHIAREASWGRIIGLTSGGDLGFPEEVSYGAAKSAQVNYTMSAAFELAPFGVTANMVYPPVTDSGWVTDAVRTFPEERPDCSAGFRRAITPVLQSYAPRPREHKRTPPKTPVYPTGYGPAQVAQFLEDDWYQRYLAGMNGVNAALLRRTAALYLCQLAASGWLADAAELLILPNPTRAYTGAKFVQRWARARPDPREFENAVHALAEHLGQSAELIDYGKRRPAMNGWCIGPGDWARICATRPLPSFCQRHPARGPSPSNRVHDRLGAGHPGRASLCSSSHP
jgi:3-oxoacyl-[acyl-carrier protein] reductase